VLVYGFINSVILALIALGFSITFGISRVANFSHGGFYVLGGVLTWYFLMKLGLPYFAAAGLAIIIVGMIGLLMYRVLLVRLRGLELSEVITTFSVGIVILELLRSLGIMGFEYRTPVFIDESVEIFGVGLGIQRIIIVGAGAVLLVALHLFVHRTRIGLAFRGVAQEEHTSLSVGINPDRISMLSLALGSTICALAAVLILPLGVISVDEGYDILIKALAVCIIGGLESTLGVLVASFIIGYIEAFTSMYISSSLVSVVPLASMLAILLIRPSGLFGKSKEIEERV
jgi:branched-chain amino acid transport system permease protein